MTEIKQITFEEILPFWLKLWAWHTPETVETHSYMRHLAGHFETFYPEIAYFGAICDNKIVGVNSVHTLPDGTCRSRGLWVDSEYRGNSIGTLLLEVCVSWATGRASCIWSYPRNTSWNSYKKAGFELSSDWKTSEQGIKNAFCILALDFPRESARM